jgi:hypothetical protein
MSEFPPGSVSFESKKTDEEKDMGFQEYCDAKQWSIIESSNKAEAWANDLEASRQEFDDFCDDFFQFLEGAYQRVSSWADIDACGAAYRQTFKWVDMKSSELGSRISNDERMQDIKKLCLEKAQELIERQLS